MKLIDTKQTLKQARNTAIIGYTVLVAVACELMNVFALKSILSIFKNDAHNIVSKKGWKILNK